MALKSRPVSLDRLSTMTNLVKNNNYTMPKIPTLLSNVYSKCPKI